MELKNIVKENLLDIKFQKENYNKSLNKLKRLQFEVNDNIFETKIEKENIAMRVFNELIILESNGHYKKLLNEEEWKGFPTWLWDTVKEKVIRTIVNTVAPSKKDTWAANVIVTGLGDIDINEIPKLGNCEFVTTQLAKAIVEGSLEHVKREMGFTSGISDLVRNALVETLEQGDLLENMKEKLVGTICPSLKKVSSGFASMESKR
jgi:hypothetical protein